MSYNFISTIHKPTSVTESVTGHFTSPHEKNLIIAKSTKIEIYTLAPEGLIPVYEANIYGRISTMKLFSPTGEKQDLLFILTERFKYCVLAFDAEKKELVTRSSGNAEDTIGRPTDSGQIAIIDPDCKVIAMHLYEGLLKIIPIEPKGTLREAYNVRLQELQVIDLVFVAPTNNQPTIAVLSKDSRDAKNVTTHILSLKDKDLLADGPWEQSNLEDGASKLIALPSGLLVVGEMLVSYIRPQTAPKAVPIAGTHITAIGKVDKDKYLFGDHLGALHLLVLHQEKEWRFEHLGETSQASSISYLDSGVVYIGSALGDSQLIRLLPERDPSTNSYIVPLENFPNLGPIIDFCVVDVDKQGQGQIVTCSGAFKDGSLRVVRNGIGITEQASIDLEGIKGLWSLSRGSDRFIVLSFMSSTKILQFQGEEIEETEIAGFDCQSPTLYCGTASNRQYLQITTTGIYLVDSQTNMSNDVWKPSRGSINLASRHENQILISHGKSLIYLEIKDKKIIQIKEQQMLYEISCLDISAFEGQSKSQLCAVGLWTDITIRLLELPSLKEVHKESLGGEIIPRSILMITFEGINYLLCSLGDGHLFNFTLDSNYSLNERKKLSLGNQPITLSKFTLKNTVNVFASSDRPTVIYSNNKKLLYSVVNLKVVTNVCSFDSEVFPDSMAIATDTTLTIGRIDEIQKLHIKKVDLDGEYARRIAHVDQQNCYALLTVKPDESGLEDSDVEQNYVRIVNQQTFETIVKYPLKENEYGWSIVTTTFTNKESSKKSNNNNNNGKDGMKLDEEVYILVATSYHVSPDKKPSGRILVFRLLDSRLILLDEVTTKGCIYYLHAMNDKVLATVNKSVYRYTWKGDYNGGKLTGEEVFNGYTVSLFIASRGDFLLVADLIKSVTLLQAHDSNVKELARSSQPIWLTACEFIDDDTYIGADNSYNLTIIRKNTESVNEADGKLLENTGCIHTGESINRFRHGSIVTNTDVEAQKIDTVLYATVNGSIGVIAPISKQDFDFFSQLIIGLNRVIKGVGGFKHNEWRSFQNEHVSNVESRNFIDGDLIEQFLYLRHDKMLEAIKDMNISIEDTYRKIESMMQHMR